MDREKQRKARKIVHVDMDAFYASVEQRDDPGLRGRPVIVAWRGDRSVVCAASYEAREFGVHSAMAAMRAQRLCPDAVFVPPDFTRYRKVSRQVREIFGRYSTLIEPLSLDEAYLDVTRNKLDLPTATEVASRIRTDIRLELGLTASAGIAPNKFLAKIASDWRKPDGQFVIRPDQAEAFLTDLPVRRIPGVGKVMNRKLAAAGVHTVGELRSWTQPELQAHFGSWGQLLYRRARGQDESLVTPNRPRRSLSAEDTFAQDRPLSALAPEIRRLADRVWTGCSQSGGVARTVVLKLKTSDFRSITRSHTPASPPSSASELTEIALGLTARVDLPPDTLYRLVGVGLGNFSTPANSPQADLFSPSTILPNREPPPSNNDTAHAADKD